MGGVAASAGNTRADTGAMVDAIIDGGCTGGDARRYGVTIGLGSFSTGIRAEGSGRDPSTGEAVTIPAAKAVKFTVARVFNDAVNA
ncbi:HU family DNA-binding protein [Paraburkholderia sp. HD33-4]|uniref:HU family DNA-binding protein n=1 Tax=Paraburkholderia sp. HD33-4 TaxID=2883242 RepID=UPI003FA3CA83